MPTGARLKGGTLKLEVYFSFEVKNKTVVVLDDASVYRNWKIKVLRKIWEDRVLFLFYLPIILFGT